MTEDTESNEAKNTSKYPIPKILLVDVDIKVSDHLKKIGFNISDGSFGKYYKVNNPDQEYIVDNALDFPPYYSDSKIVVIDLTPKVVDYDVDVTDKSRRKIVKVRSRGNILDTRPLGMRECRPIFEKMRQDGRIFIVFANPYSHIDYTLYDGISGKAGTDNIFSFLKELSRVNIENYTGEVINTVDADEARLTDTFQQHLSSATYNCTFIPNFPPSTRWITIAEKGFGSSVAGIIGPPPAKTLGWIFLLPHIEDKRMFLQHLFEDYLPSILPSIFPYEDSTPWLHSENYEITEILLLKTKIASILEEAHHQVIQVNNEIERIRSKNQFLHNIITESGDTLVQAIKTTLELFGFQQVFDMDAELDQEESSGKTRREDLQVRDQKPLLLVEIKGVTGTSKDKEALQVSKYVAQRARALNLPPSDIKGLSIVNHQRNWPLLDREQNPFNEDILESAHIYSFGLLTTFNLFKLIRSFKKLSWTHGQVAPLFYQDGFIEPVPVNYEYIGLVEHYYPEAKAVTIQIKESAIELNNRIAFELPLEFVEQSVDSLQIERNPVQIVKVDELAGVKTAFTKDQLRKGTRVFLVRT